MAEILDLDDDSFSEENVVRPPKPSTASSSDSDSDAGSVPKIKKMRSTRSAVSVCLGRGSPLATQNDNSPSPTATLTLPATQPLFATAAATLPRKPNIYSGIVGSSFEAIKAGKIPSKLIHVSDDDVDDSDEEIENLFKKKKPRSRAKAKQTSSRSRRRPSTSDSQQDVKAKDELDTYQSKMIFIEDEDTEVESDDSNDAAGQNGADLSLSQAREPTPPPSPGPDLIALAETGTKTKSKNSRRSKRRETRANAAKAAKEAALKNLQTIISLDALNEDSIDQDVSIVEVTPTKSESERDLSVKIRSRSGIQRFSMKMKQSFADIVSEMAKHEFVQEYQVALYLGDRKIQMYDTPSSINLQIADIIECLIRKKDAQYKEESADEDDSVDPDVFKIRVQGKDAKSRLVLQIHKDEPMEKIMREYCQRKNLNFGDVTFQLDGDDIERDETPDDLGLETNDCIDVIL